MRNRSKERKCKRKIRVGKSKMKVEKKGKRGKSLRMKKLWVKNGMKKGRSNLLVRISKKF